MYLRSSHSPVEILFSSLASSDISHGFTTARNGFSSGAYGRGNLSWRVGDDPSAVQRNWDGLLGSLGIAAISLPLQVHGIHSAYVGAPLEGEVIEADALWTDQPGVAIGVLTADCMPILLELRDQSDQLIAVAAVHAGWKGALGNILAACFGEVSRQWPQVYAPACKAFLGPSICGSCYEVGQDLAEKFSASGYGGAVQWQNGNSLLDLWKVAVLQLSSLGFLSGNIDIAAECTKCCAGYFSYRRCSDTGRELAFIWMK
ncbi:polyphenol oxidase family protein [Desulfurispirillum indicum]|uniref:polyphenol oxidase family protein n=1 Tax=Desulfurispirillum indicum TaxID=936456 RepID=UPI001CFA6C9E|nr:polyphenol oxidase family protein [Desulfurispirillum indicum]UCZ56830.1 polyphenol oxidase family protein [Desulfurispirillum indicum]